MRTSCDSGVIAPWIKLVAGGVWRQSGLVGKVVWITLLGMRDRDGYVKGNVAEIAGVAGAGVYDTKEALEWLGQLPEAEFGVSVRAVEGGWLVRGEQKLNEELAAAYRREYLRKKMAAYRKRRREREAKTLCEVFSAEAEKANVDP